MTFWCLWAPHDRLPSAPASILLLLLHSLITQEPNGLEEEAPQNRPPSVPALSLLFLLLHLVTQEPNGIEEEAVLLVERSKESRNPAIKRDLLARCEDAGEEA